jgi:regulator of sirC expression with transglutaminase-like and TPR domain
MTLPREAIRVLRAAGEMPDDGFDLADVALALAALDNPNVDTAPYRDHLANLIEQVKAEGVTQNLDDRLRLLRRVLVVQNKYRGDDDIYEDLRNANLMHVIDRRRGLPIALGIIYLYVAEKVGWPMAGLNFPGHFLVRLSASNGRAILDPFRAGQTCKPEDLRAILPADSIEAIERLPEYYTPVGKREVLLRLQNNIKRRQLGMDRIEAAINTLQSMILLAPRRHDLWRELGYMQADRGNLRSAITALEVVCDLAGDVEQTHQSGQILTQLRRQLN